MYAVDLKQDGKSYSQIIRMVEKKRNKTHVFLVLDDLTYIVRGGRLPSKVKTLANVLRLRPIIGPKNGKLKARGVLWGKSNMTNKFSKFLESKINKNIKYRMMIAHANSKKEGIKLEKLLLSSHSENIENSYVVELGGALGAHAGPGALAIGLQEIN